jgi:hypothetical protein
MEIKNNKNIKCQYFNEKKKRFCKFEKYKDNLFCIAHISNDEILIDCPVDKTHKILKEKLEKHIKVCTKGK